jgi:hypothetical protein
MIDKYMASVLFCIYWYNIRRAYQSILHEGYFDTMTKEEVSQLILAHAGEETGLRYTKIKEIAKVYTGKDMSYSEIVNYLMNTIYFEEFKELKEKLNETN